MDFHIVDAKLKPDALIVRVHPLFTDRSEPATARAIEVIVYVFGLFPGLQ